MTNDQLPVTEGMFSVGTQRPVSYFKRFKMEFDLFDAPPAPVLPPGYYLEPWDDGLLDLHAEVMFAAFQEEIDALVFPSLGDRQGCLNLMNEIRNKRGFMPAATWLIGSPDGYCGTIQGIRERSGLGAIQNIGITAAQRGRGLGSVLLLSALHGFRQAGLGRVYLEVTAQNDGAVRLYRRLGFRSRKTVYKAVDTAARCLNGS
jgi:ribosomal protein S18 acetylase RimI-like enzyme